MTLEEGALISTIAQAFLVTFSLAFVAYQLWQNLELAKASNAQRLTEQAASFNALLHENPELAELWYSYGRDPNSLDRIEKLRYREMLVQRMIFHENVYHQWKKGFLNVELYEAWQKDLERTIKYHNFDLLAKDITTIFSGQFGREVARLQRVTREADSESS